MSNYLDDKTIEIAKEYDLDKKLIRKCIKTKNSFDKEDVIYHRNLQTQVYAASNYTNKDARKVNNQIIHYGDKPNELLKDLPKLQKELQEKYITR
jgi:hypothetical protein